MKRGNFRSEENIYLATQFAEWFGHLTGKKVGEGDESFCESLNDGTVLCKVIQRIEGSEVSKIHDPAGNPFQGRENIGAFQEACHRLELPFVLSVSHIKDKRVDAVISCLLGVAKFAAEQGGLDVPAPILEKLAIGMTSSTAHNKRAEASEVRKNDNKEREEGLCRNRSCSAFAEVSPADIVALQSHLGVLAADAPATAAVPAATEEGEPEVALAEIVQTGEPEVTLATLVEIVPTLPAASLERKIRVTRAVRMLVSALQHDSTASAESVVAAGILPILVAFLNRTDSPILQFEAAWALMNVASTHATGKVVQSGAVASLVPLLRSPNPDVRMQAAWCLGNIAAGSEVWRDKVLSTPDAMEGLLSNLTHPQGRVVWSVRNTVWAVSILCRGESPVPDLRLVAPAVPMLVACITHDVDRITTTDACWALAHISGAGVYSSDQYIEAVVSQGAAAPLVNLLAKFSEEATVDTNKAVAPALRTLGNIVMGTALQTQVALDAGLLQQLTRLLANTTRELTKREACWAASNVTAGTKEQVSAFMEEPGLVKEVMHQLREAGSGSIREDAAYCITNVCKGGRKEDVQYLMNEHSFAGPLCELLQVHDVPMVLQALEATKHVLEADPVAYAEILIEVGGMEIIESLQLHVNENVYRMAVSLMEKYFLDRSDWHTSTAMEFVEKKYVSEPVRYYEKTVVYDSGCIYSYFS